MNYQKQLLSIKQELDYLMESVTLSEEMMKFNASPAWEEYAANNGLKVKKMISSVLGSFDKNEMSIDSFVKTIQTSDYTNWDDKDFQEQFEVYQNQLIDATFDKLRSNGEKFKARDDSPYAVADAVVGVYTSKIKSAFQKAKQKRDAAWDKTWYEQNKEHTKGVQEKPTEPNTPVAPTKPKPTTEPKVTTKPTTKPKPPTVAKRSTYLISAGVFALGVMATLLFIFQDKKIIQIIENFKNNITKSFALIVKGDIVKGFFNILLAPFKAIWGILQANAVAFGLFILGLIGLTYNLYKAYYAEA